MSIFSASFNIRSGICQLFVMNYCNKKKKGSKALLSGTKGSFNDCSSSAVAVKRKGCFQERLFWLFAGLIHMFCESISIKTEVRPLLSCTVIVLLISVCRGFDK